MADHHVCPTCGTQFTVKRSLDRHENKFNGHCRKRGEVNCTICQKTFSRSDALVRHQRTAHAQPAVNITNNIVNNNNNINNINNINIVINITPYTEGNRITIPDDLIKSICRSDKIMLEYIRDGKSPEDLVEYILTELIRKRYISEPTSRNAQLSQTRPDHVMILTDANGKWIPQTLTRTMTELLDDTARQVVDAGTLAPCEHNAMTAIVSDYNANKASKIKNSTSSMVANLRTNSILDENDVIECPHAGDECPCKKCPVRKVWGNGPQYDFTEKDLLTYEAHKECGALQTMRYLVDHLPNSVRKYKGQLQTWNGEGWDDIGSVELIDVLSKEMGVEITLPRHIDRIAGWIANLEDWY